MLASALLGLPSQILGFVPDLGFIDFHTSTLSGYVQDQWSVKPNLTVTYGLRYDYITRAYGESGTFQSGPDFRTGEWLLAVDSQPPVCSTVANQPPCLPRPLEQIPFNQYIKTMGETNAVLPPIKDNFGPRLGVAWQINNETVLRGGYALMWDSMVSRSQYGQHQFETWGWPQVSGFDTGVINTIGGAVTPLESYSSLGIGAPRAEPWNSTGFFNAPDRKNAYSHQWHVELQRQITRNLMVGVAYVGSYNGRMEYSGRAALPKVAAIEPGTGRRLTPAERNQLREWPHITGDFRYSDDIGMSKFNSFQLKAQQRFAKGFTSMLSYTWSRTIDTSSGWFDAEGGIGGRAGPELLGHRRRARDLGLRHPAHPDLGLDLGAPVRTGQALAERRRRRVVDPRQLAGELDAARPLGPADGHHRRRRSREPRHQQLLARRPRGRSRAVGSHARPVVQHGGLRGADQRLRRPRPAASCARRASGTWTSRCRRTCRSAAARQLQLRVEAFNVFNTINDGNPNVDITNANFGRITSMSGRPRHDPVRGAVRLLA